MRVTILILLVLIFGCSKDGEPDPTCDSTPIQPTSVTIKQDANGFVDTDHCDSLLFTGMISSAGFSVNITAAENSDGEWYRRPTSYEECWASGSSRSTISRDMLLGVYWHAWTHKDLAMLYRIWYYAIDNNWVMGDGRYNGADTVMNFAMMSTLAQMIWVLSGEELETNYLGNLVTRNLPVTWGVTTDTSQLYVNRLTALHIILRNEVYGSVSQNAKDTVREMAELWPNNPLFLYASGNTCSATSYANRSDLIPAGIHGESEYVYERIFVLGRLTK